MSVPKATLLAAIVNAVAKLPEPSKSPVPVTSPVNDKVLAVASAEAVVALPLKAPVNCVDVNTPELGLYVKPVSDSIPCEPVAPSTKTG